MKAAIIATQHINNNKGPLYRLKVNSTVQKWAQALGNPEHLGPLTNNVIFIG